ncbi:MAG: hypothetical protein HY974_01770 [Candidatus Kerfeldbacteria bacterium]|nr:hypothetical protein [Candidatus Kerfeldbacteria bacterium]
MKILANFLVIPALVVLVGVAVVRLVLVYDFVPGVVARVRNQQESVRPARLKLTVVTDSSCLACTDPEPFVKALSEQRAELAVRRLVPTTTEGKQYLAEQKLDRLPAVVVQGELTHHSELTDFLALAGWNKQGTSFTYLVPAPYREFASNKVRGEFKATYLAYPGCTSCYDVSSNTIPLQNLGVTVREDSTVSALSPEGQALVRRYNLRYLPTVLLEGDLDVYPQLQAVWPQVGTREADGTYVLRAGVKLMGTYYDRTLKRPITPEQK